MSRNRIDNSLDSQSTVAKLNDSGNSSLILMDCHTQCLARQQQAVDLIKQLTETVENKNELLEKCKTDNIAMITLLKQQDSKITQMQDRHEQIHNEAKQMIAQCREEYEDKYKQLDESYKQQLTTLEMNIKEKNNIEQEIIKKKAKIKEEERNQRIATLSKPRTSKSDIKDQKAQNGLKQ